MFRYSTVVLMIALLINPLIALLSSPSTGLAAEKTIEQFSTSQLTDTYFSEGAGAGDLDGDGIPDVVYGPYWFKGPKYEEKFEIYPPVPQNVNGYADHFFVWIYDFDDDGFNDLLTVGFPGTPAYVYRNPGRDGLTNHWQKHQVFDWVSNESPQFVDIVGDKRPELVCSRDGFFGFVTVNWERPFEAWAFHPISERVTAPRFGHGLGIGDVNGDGRQDLIHAEGWFEQPENNALVSRWTSHPVSFSNAYGGAEMHAYDVDGDGDSDVITSHAAHEYGLGWYEQIQDDQGKRTFKHHTIMGMHPSENEYGVLFTELHSVALADMDGDGLKDIVTGKTYWSHHRQSPMWNAGAVVYWFRLDRREDGVHWVPYKIDSDAGIGRQLCVTDLNGDGLFDLALGGMKGCHAVLHKRESVSEEQWQAAQPKQYSGDPLPTIDQARPLRGPKVSKSLSTGKVVGAIEAESLKSRATSGNVGVQEMKNFNDDSWSGDRQLFWTGAVPGESLEIELPPCAGKVTLEVCLTCASDYGVVEISIDDQVLGVPIDLYDPKVITTGLIVLPEAELTSDSHVLTFKMIGRNPIAEPAMFFGIDYVRVRDATGKFTLIDQEK